MPGVLPALCVGGEDADAALGWRWECLQLSNGFPEATIQVWSFIGDGKCHRNFLLNKKGLSLST